jgi:hypothetical protein
VNEQEIQKHTNDRFFKRGKFLYRRGAVFDMLAEDFGDEHHISASIIGDSGTEYDMGILIEDDHIIEHWCDCPAADEFGDMCKHCVALALEYMEKQRGLAFLLPKRGTRTDAALKELMYSCSMEQQARYMQAEVTGSIELEPFLLNRYGRWEVEFRIGSDRKYVLKDIYAFVNAMEQKEKVEYGKFLAFIHERSAFTAESGKIADFLIQCVETRRNVTYAQSRSTYLYGWGEAKARSMVLTEQELTQFLDLCAETPESGCRINSASKKDLLKIQQQDPPLRITLKTAKNAAGYDLEISGFSAIRGKDRLYILRQDTAYRCSEEFTKEMGEFCACVSEGIRDKSAASYFIAEKDMNVFCASLYPRLARHTDFRTKEDLSLFMPEPCAIHIYLDKSDEKVTCRLESAYGGKRHNLMDDLETKDLYRDMLTEGRAKQTAQAYFPELDVKGNLWFAESQDDLMYQLISTGVSQLAETGEVYVSDALSQVSIRKVPAAGVSVDLKGGLLDLQILSGTLPYEELEALLASYRLRRKYHRLKDGDFLMLEGSALETISELTEGLELPAKALKTGKIQVPRYRSFYVDQVLKESSNMNIQRSSSYKELVRSMKAVEDSDFEVPEHLSGILRRYQKDGYRWLMTLEALGFGGILADDMGLGKSLQLLTFLYAHTRQKSTENPGPSLLVCPASLVYNWQGEVEKFVPHLKTLLITGTAAERRKKLETCGNYDLLVTSYDLLKRDVEIYEDLDFYCQILDEAQNIKNHTTKAAKAVKGIKAQVRFALTGTPIENRLSELWSIFDFLMPGILGSYKSFRDKYELPIVQREDEVTAKRLQRMIRPFLLRRLKSDVLKELPDKSETVIYSKLEGEQQDLYSANAQKLLESIKNTDPQALGTEKIKILAGLTRLRQLCCDPHLLYEDYKGGAAKLEACMELIRTAVSSGHKILLFSQFTSMLDLIQSRLVKEKIESHMLTGATSKEKRADLVKAFHEDDVPIFLISLKAGGTGLNLTAASIVIHFDPWWNLAAQNQATDRAHRIGQDKEVTVYKLIAKSTIEEKIQKLQDTKAQLSEKIIAQGTMSVSQLTQEDFMELLR